MKQDPIYWTEVEDLFDALVDLDAAARSRLLDQRCANRPDLRAEVETLLAAHARADALIGPVTARGTDEAESAPPGVGSVIGPFRLVEVIGQGGMGTVYRATRADEAFDQQVAVKVIATLAAHASAARRFRAERQILASLRHAHIVSLLDGGVTSNGYAYLVMEYVEGVPIATHCREQRLSLAGRLQLFRGVCAAVQYAHRHAVVHRDLKPANILVTPDGVPKVLDFGVAKMLDDSASAAGVTLTNFGAGPLTPNYASPEQLRGLAVTTSSDIYALGVLLFELLAGVRPYETAGKPLDEVMRLVVNADPPKPSATPAPPESGLPYESKRTLKGDLDAIVLRAMAKSPEDRYGSAEELADDVGRHAAGTPVAAREPSFAYVMRKLAGRHKIAFLAAGGSLILIVGALGVALWQAKVATLERQRAEHRFAEVRRFANALVFKIHDTVAPLPGSTPVRRTIVAEALGYSERLARESLEPVEVARAYVEIGEVQGLFLAQGPVLEVGVRYRITVQGTFSVHSPEAWRTNVCPLTEPRPMFPSPDAENGPVERDAEYGDVGVLSPIPGPHCVATGTDHTERFQMSLDGGGSFGHIEAENVGTSANPSHTYEYTVTGQGHAIVFRVRDEPIDDNYGVLRATIERL